MFLKSFQYVQKNLFNFLGGSIDRRWYRKEHRDSDDGEKTQAEQIVRKQSKAIRKQFNTYWKSLENVPKIGWVHCFGWFWNFRIHMGFDTLILHVSVWKQKTVSRYWCWWMCCYCSCSCCYGHYHCSCGGGETRVGAQAGEEPAAATSSSSRSTI